MTEPRKLRSYEYVNRAHQDVSDVLRHRPLELLQRATTSAAARASALAATLHFGSGAFEVGVDVKIQLESVRNETWVKGMSPVTRLDLAWKAARAAALFPSMKATLSAWPLSPTETQLEIEGEYKPPLGAVGSAIDAVVGHRIAEASVHRFLEDVVEELRREIPERK